MQMGFLTRTPRGRCARLAYEHLGMNAPESGRAPEDNGQQSLF